jgi:farnesyl-diphosphate farnesyltransferase
MALESRKIQDLLKQVSRSFFLTLRILPGSIRQQLSIAYLLARATDTVADTELVQSRRRLEALLQIRECVHAACDGRAIPPVDYSDVAEASAGSGGTSAERLLLLRLRDILLLLAGFQKSDRLHVRTLLDTIIGGQENDILFFNGASAGNIIALAVDQDLDRYTYQVAGCVGEFWTRMCVDHEFSKSPAEIESLLANGIDYGKGLQLVNILRDLPKDLRQGRCYMPLEQLASAGLNPCDLLESSAMTRFKPIYDVSLRRAERYLSAGIDYVLSLPYRCVRVRLACAWPILIGIDTLEKLHRCNILDADKRIKTSRSEVRSIIAKSVVLYPMPGEWNKLFMRKGS